MLEFLTSIWIIAKWFIFEFIPQIAGASLGAIGEFIDALGFIKFIILGIGVLTTLAVKLIKRKI